MWNINSYDQWGVELGKQLAGELLPMVKNDVAIEGRDGSTEGLLAAFHEMRAREFADSLLRRRLPDL